MIKIKILKNGKAIKEIKTIKRHQQSEFERAMNLAGAMFNGKDEFSVIIVPVSFR